jgi:hypothetical protein
LKILGVNAKNTSGQISLKNETIVCSTPEKTNWSLPIADVRVLAEFTNEAGPHLDDYFFLFVTSDASSWYCASFYADGRDKFLEELGSKLGTKLQCGLCNSTSFKSRVMWPVNLEGTPLFEFEPQIPTANFLSRVQQKFFPNRKVRLVKDVQITAGLKLN